MINERFDEILVRLQLDKKIILIINLCWNLRCLILARSFTSMRALLVLESVF